MLKIFVTVLIMIILGTVLYINRTRRFEREISEQLEKINNCCSTNMIESEPFLFSKDLTDEINKLITTLADERKECNRNKDDIKKVITAISHDFRTPLTSINGYVQFLMEDEQYMNKEKRQEYLSIIKARSESLAVLVEDFYVNSCLESGEYPKAKKMIPVIEILKNTLVQYYNELERRFEFININLPEEKIKVPGDEAYMQRIFSNIIKNAFMHGTSAFNVVEQNDNDTLRIIIANRLFKEIDSNQFNAERIFERNYSVDWASGSISTGLGMAIAKKLMEEMGHKIYVKAEDMEISFILEFKIC